MSENGIDTNDACTIKSNECKTNAIVDVKRRFRPNNNAISPRRVCSVPELESDTNNYYDNARGSWKFDSVPLRDQHLYQSSILHIAKLIAPEDVTCMRKQQDKKLILLFLEKKILHITPYKGRNQEILVKLLWQTFKIFKEKLFGDQKISTVLGLMLSTHSFYLANYWNTAEETYKYIYERVLSCTVMDPPKCAEIFAPNEAWMILEFFRETYLENIVLLHLVCATHYRIIIRFGDDRQ